MKKKILYEDMVQNKENIIIYQNLFYLDYGGIINHLKNI